MLPRVVTAPDTEPVSLAEAKAHLRLEESDDDLEVTTMITAARQWAEEYLWRGIVTQTLELTLPRFPSRDEESIELRGGELASITSVTYVDSNGDEQTLDPTSYAADTASLPGHLRLAYGESWPSTRRQWDAVKVRYVVGRQVRRAFQASTAYAVGAYVYPTAANGHYYKVTSAGTSGADEPTWTTASGGTVPSGSVVFTEQGTRDLEDEVQKPIQQACLLLISQMYEHRTPEVAGTIVSPVRFSVEALLNPYRLARL